MKFILIILLLVPSFWAYSDKPLPDEGKTLTVAWSHYPPYQDQDAQGKAIGLDQEVIAEVAKRAGYHLQYKNLPWQRVVKNSLKNAEVDIAMYATKTAERSDYAHFSSIPYFPEDAAIFILQKDEKQFTSIEHLFDFINHDYRIGVHRESIYSNLYEELLKNEKFYSLLHFSHTDAQNVKMLVTQRVDAIFSGELRTIQLLREMSPNSKIVRHSYINMNDDNMGAYIMMSKASISQADYQKINNALLSMKKDGTLDKITQKYRP